MGKTTLVLWLTACLVPHRLSLRAQIHTDQVRVFAARAITAATVFRRTDPSAPGTPSRRNRSDKNNKEMPPAANTSAAISVRCI